MVRNLGKLLMLICLLTVGGVVVANAQVDTVPQIEVDVPFDFVVGDTRLPAGKYEIKTIDDIANNVLEIRSIKGHTSVVFDTSDTETRGDRIENKTELVFEKVQGQYFLNQIWVAGSSTGNQLAISRTEKRLASGGSQPEKQSVFAVLKRLKP
jgi:hypothetical protein